MNTEMNETTQLTRIDYTVDVQETTNEKGDITKEVWFVFENYPDIKFTYRNITFTDYEEDKQLAHLLFDLDYQYQVSDEPLSEESKEALKSIAQEKVLSEEFQVQVQSLLSEIVHSLAQKELEKSVLNDEPNEQL